MSYPLYRSIPEKHLIIILLSKLQKYTISNLLLKSCRNTVLLWYLFRGRSLHSKTHVLFLKPGDVFNSHVNLKIQLTHFHPSPPHSYPSYPYLTPFHKLCQFFTQFTKNTQNHFDTHFDKTIIFPSKTKLSDNLKI